MTGVLPLPVTVEEITPEWLTAALRVRQPGATIRQVTIVDVNHGTNAKIRLELDRDAAAIETGIPERVVLKGGFGPHSRGAELSEMYLREVRGYRDVLPVLDLHTPACFFADHDAERGQGIIIMEDLATRDVTFCHAQRPQDFEQVARRLTALARFHAQTWDSPAVSPGGQWGYLGEFLDSPGMNRFFAKYTRPENWERFTSAPRGAAMAARFHDLDWTVRAWHRQLAFAKTLPVCLLHGDTHMGNLYIEPDGTPGFFDPLSSLGPGMLEVAYHVTGAVDLADRPRWEGALVQHYLAELARNGVSPPAFDEAMRQFGIFQVYGHFIWMTTESQYQPEAINTVNVARVCAAMLHHDTIGLIDALAD